MAKFFKNAGVLDAPRAHLASDVWGQDSKLLPNIRTQIIESLVHLVPRENILGILIVGSITGYKYRNTSDIDVNVYVISKKYCNG